MPTFYEPGYAAAPDEKPTGIKRYDLVLLNHGCDPDRHFKEDPAGEYCLAEDVAAYVVRMGAALDRAEKRVALLEGLLREARPAIACLRSYTDRYHGLLGRVQGALANAPAVPDVQEIVDVVEQAMALEGGGVCTVCEGKGVTYSKRAGACPLPCWKCQP